MQQKINKNFFSVHSQFTPLSRLLIATKWRIGENNVEAVDPGKVEQNLVNHVPNIFGNAKLSRY